ncbi:MAG TPA: hypothetical protein VHG29_04975 [Novosphingobium sp.]|nr:hypothetical protein [Novosphingobium sp.]
MKKIAFAALASAAALTLSACGSSDSASEKATAEDVEMPAEEAMNTTDASPAPIADTATATASDATAPAPEASAAAEAATQQAEKKM